MTLTLGMALLALVLAQFLSSCVLAQGEADQNARCLSPYFWVKSDHPDLDPMPLLKTTAEVSITGVIADVKVTQVYKNDGKRPIEATYVFPASTRAAVYGLTMTVGDRTVTAKIRERQQARKEYETARQEGKTASLLEQQRPNVFQMNVANILPGDSIQVVLQYTELLVPTHAEYEFVYPAVVGPRYSNKPAETAPQAENWVASPYLHQAQLPSYAFDVKLNLSTGIPLQDMACPTHPVKIDYAAPDRARVTLSDPATAGNRDYILKYRLAGESIQSGLLLSRGQDENFFLLMMQPPKRVQPKDIPPREYIFIVDVSGSMYGFPLDVSKKMMKELIGRLRPSDSFNVMTFSGSSSVFSPTSLPATQANAQRAIHMIESESGGGGTELLPALTVALALPGKEGTSRSVVILTDGFVDVESEAFDLIRKQLGKANFFPFGIGTSVNRFLIEGMAHAGMGEPFVITKPEEAPAAAEKFCSYIQSPVLTGIRVDFNGFPAYDIEPASVPDILADRPVILFGKWRGNSDSQPGGTIRIRGISGKSTFEQVFHVNQFRPSPENGALRYLWARKRIEVLGDYNRLHEEDARTKEITRLGLAYNLLTRYTSFVAVYDVVRRPAGQAAETVQQPLPLPQGVSDLAVAGCPEPAAELLLLLLIPLLGGAWWHHRRLTADRKDRV